MEHVKYLILLTDPKLKDPLHVTYAFFGKEIVDISSLSICYSTLTKDKPDMFGENNDIIVMKYTAEPNLIAARKEMFATFSPEVNKLNKPWSPHVSVASEDEFKQLPEKITVIGFAAVDNEHNVLKRVYHWN